MTSDARFAALDELRAVPERWGSTKGLRSGEGTSRDEIELALSIGERLSKMLVDVDPDLASADERTAFNAAFPDRREISRSAVESVLRTHSLSPEIFWSWLARQAAWLTLDVLNEIPSHGEDDPDGLRDLAFDFFERTVDRLPDFAQATWVSSLAQCVGLRIEPIATRLFRDPKAGPELKRAVRETFTPEVLARIEQLANEP